MDPVMHPLSLLLCNLHASFLVLSTGAWCCQFPFCEVGEFPLLGICCMTYLRFHVAALLSSDHC
jgi:hypothetical protein